ncbi:DUF159 family protein [Comamonas serinivorans]|uniref:Abasic site processing protein n=1 Tax=Comamonas serinivorans TaxID=1082851 RepID=A0A1Y0EM38_9BURK|nr:SOS response-associated peptidase family protein [Comamonas serinivorans]ARU04724.1 DUF159 family protein [Comamonas serinivorans]
MCNRYIAPSDQDIQQYWRVNGAVSSSATGVFPRSPGPFIRRAIEDASYSRELVVGQWGLIPWFAKERKLKYSTNNARSEELLSKASYKDPWRRGQRCIIPATSFDEPNWETGKNVWWTFQRADGDPWGLAGLWNRWHDPETDEMVESYTMLTINADAHPLMSRMHKPDPKLGPDQQDKRSVIPIELSDVDLWLSGTVAEASELLRLAPVEVFDARPTA